MYITLCGGWIILLFSVCHKNNDELYTFAVRPQILPFSFGDHPSNAGDKVQVGCTVAKGDQPLRISWNFYGEELSSNMGVSTMAVGDSMNVLFIPFVAPSNKGSYTCVAINPAGQDSYTAQLLVNGIHHT